MKKIAATAVWWSAVRFCGRNTGQIAAMAVFPVVISSLLWIVFDFLTDPGAGKKSVGETFASSLVTTYIFLVFVPYYIALHRLTLLGERCGVRSSWPRLDFREMRYAVGTFLIFTLLAAFSFDTTNPAIETETSMNWWSWLAAVVWLFVVVRSAFVFVGLAVDSDLGVRKDWQLTSVYTFRLLYLGVLSAAPFYIPLTVVFAFIYTATGQPLPESEALVVDALQVTLGAVTHAVVAAIWVTATSMAYRDVSEWWPTEN